MSTMSSSAHSTIVQDLDDVKYPNPSNSNSTESKRTDEPSPVSELAHVVPDGGFKAWSTLAGAFLVVFCSSGYVNSFGVYEDYYVRVYLSHHSQSQINWIGGIQTCCLFSVGIFSGYAMDIGLFRPVMLFGSVLFVFCLFMVSLSQPQQWYQLFLAQGIGLGLAIGLIYIPALGVVAHHFKRRRSLAMGIAASGSSLGGVIHPIMLNNLIHGPVGFHWAVRASAFFNMALLAIALCCMSTRLPPKQGKKLSNQFRSYVEFLKDLTFVVATVGVFLVITGIYFPTLYIQLDAIEHGVSQSLAFYTLSILNGCSAFGRVVPTIVADRVGVFKMLVPCAVVCGVLIFAMEALTNATGAVVIAVLYGLFSGCCISLMGPMVANLSKDVYEIGARLGLCLGIGGLGSLIAPPIIGALLTSKLIWIRPIIFCGICMFAGAFGIAVAGVLTSRKLTSSRENEKS